MKIPTTNYTILIMPKENSKIDFMRCFLHNTQAGWCEQQKKILKVDIEENVNDVLFQQQ